MGIDVQKYTGLVRNEFINLEKSVAGRTGIDNATKNSLLLLDDYNKYLENDNIKSLKESPIVFDMWVRTLDKNKATQEIPDAKEREDAIKAADEWLKRNQEIRDALASAKADGKMIFEKAQEEAHDAENYVGKHKGMLAGLLALVPWFLSILGIGEGGFSIGTLITGVVLAGVGDLVVSGKDSVVATLYNSITGNKDNKPATPGTTISSPSQSNSRVAMNDTKVHAGEASLGELPTPANLPATRGQINAKGQVNKGGAVGTSA